MNETLTFLLHSLFCISIKPVDKMSSMSPGKCGGTIVNKVGAYDCTGWIHRLISRNTLYRPHIVFVLLAMVIVLRTTDLLLEGWGQDISDTAEEQSGPGECWPKNDLIMDFIGTSSINQEITNRIDIVTPGHLENYDRKRLEVNGSMLLLIVLCFYSGGDKSKICKRLQGKVSQDTPTLCKEQTRSKWYCTYQDKKNIRLLWQGKSVSDLSSK